MLGTNLIFFCLIIIINKRINTPVKSSFMRLLKILIIFLFVVGVKLTFYQHKKKKLKKSKSQISVKKF